MGLPNGSAALVDMRKVRDYCLNPDHPRGRFKARVFASVLGITQDAAEVLRDALLDAAEHASAELGELDEYGQRYAVEFEFAGPKGSAIIRSAWIVLSDEDFPRFVSAYVK